MPVARPLLRRSLAAVVVAVLALSGCNDAESPKADPSSPTTASSTAAVPVVPATVTLVDPGTVPRRVVAIAVEEGHSESSTVQMTSRTTSDFMSSSSPPPLTLVMTIPLTTTVAEVTAGEITVDVRYGRATVSDGGTGVRKDMLDQATQAVRYVEGVTAREIYTTSGTLVERAVAVGEEAPDFVQRILDDVVAQGFALNVSLPTEEIGVGARWKVDSEITVGGGKSRSRRSTGCRN